jgi:hypothetical protein
MSSSAVARTEVETLAIEILKHTKPSDKGSNLKLRVLALEVLAKGVLSELEKQALQTRKKREVLDWQMEITNLLEALTPGVQRGAWVAAAEKRAGKKYCLSTFSVLIQIMKGEGTGNRKINPLITQSGSRATATYNKV